MSYLIPFMTEILLRLENVRSQIKGNEELLHAFYGSLHLIDAYEEFSLSC
jgi:hypothetical protein